MVASTDRTVIAVVSHYDWIIKRFEKLAKQADKNDTVAAADYRNTAEWVRRARNCEVTNRPPAGLSK